METWQIVFAVVFALFILHSVVYSYLSWRGRREPLTFRQRYAFRHARDRLEDMALSELDHVQRLRLHFFAATTDEMRERLAARLAEREQFLEELRSAYKVLYGLVDKQGRDPSKPVAYSFPFCWENYGGRAEDFPPLTHKLKGVPSLVCYFLTQGGFVMAWQKRCWCSDDVTVFFSIPSV